MSIETIIILVAIFMVFPLSKAIERKAAQEKAEREGIQDEKEREAAKVRDAVFRAYFSLKRQKASGYGPWLSSIIGRIGEPQKEATRAEVIEALRRTREELTGSRFDLSVIDSALEELGGRG